MIFSDFNLFCRCLPMYLYDAIVLILHWRLYPYSLASDNVFSCVSDYSTYYQVALWAPKFLVLCYGLFLTWRIRNIEDRYHLKLNCILLFSYNETKYIVISVWHLVVAIGGVTFFSIVLQSLVREVNLYIAASFAAMFVCVAVLFFLFLPKLVGVFGASKEKTPLEGSETPISRKTKKIESSEKSAIVTGEPDSDVLKMQSLEKEFASKASLVEAERLELTKLIHTLNAMREDQSYSGGVVAGEVSVQDDVSAVEEIVPENASAPKKNSSGHFENPLFAANAYGLSPIAALNSSASGIQNLTAENDNDMPLPQRKSVQENFDPLEIPSTLSNRKHSKLLIEIPVTPSVKEKENH